MEVQNSKGFKKDCRIRAGPVAVGNVDVKRFQYNIWDDTVIIASRMESSGEVGVNISQTT